MSTRPLSTRLFWAAEVLLFAAVMATTILSTHHMNQVETLCDRVVLINKGRVMVYGEVGEVRRRYSLPVRPAARPARSSSSPSRATV